MMKNIKIYEEYFQKIKGKVRYFDGEEPFRIDVDTGKLYKTLDSNVNENTFYLTYDEYKKLEQLNDTIVEKIKLLNEQKQTTIEIFKNAAKKVLKDRQFFNTVKKYNI